MTSHKIGTTDQQKLVDQIRTMPRTERVWLKREDWIEEGQPGQCQEKIYWWKEQMREARGEWPIDRWKEAATRGLAGRGIFTARPCPNSIFVFVQLPCSFAAVPAHIFYWAPPPPPPPLRTPNSKRVFHEVCSNRHSHERMISAKEQKTSP